MQEKLVGFELARLKAEGSSTRFEISESLTVAMNLRKRVPMTLQELLSHADEATSKGFYFEIGPEDAGALSFLLRELQEIKARK